MAPPSPPRRKRDTVQRENFADLVDEKRRHLVKSKEFSLDDGSFTPGEVEVVLFDVYSLDSFVAFTFCHPELGEDRLREEHELQINSLSTTIVELTKKLRKETGTKNVQIFEHAEQNNYFDEENGPSKGHDDAAELSARREAATDSLYLMTTALKGSALILTWACVLLLVLQVLIALLLNQVLYDSYLDEESETFKVASSDNQIMMRQKERSSNLHEMKMRQLFLEADNDGDGFVSAEEWRELLWLGSMDLDAADADGLYKLIHDLDQDGDLTMDELIRGVARLKGAARSYDLQMLLRQVSALTDSSEDSLPEVEKSELINLGVWIETDSRFGAGVLAWEFFNKGEPVPLLLRAVEDIHLGRGVFLDGKAMEDGIDALLEDDDIENVTLAIQGLLCPLGYREKIFQKFHSLLTDSKETKRRLQTIADRGRAREPEIRKDQLEAEFLAESLAQRCQGQENRCMGAVLEMKEGSTVRVTLRSLDGGPDVSEVNMPSSGSCLALRPTEKVTVILRDEHYQPSPQDDWSWGFKVDEPEKASKCRKTCEMHPPSAACVQEGWFPTLSYSLYIALRAESADLHNDPGVRSVKEGDILVAHVQRGKYVFGKLLPKLAL
eukprot:g9388.t1